MGCGEETLIRQQPLGEPGAKEEDDVAGAEEVNTAITGDGAEGEIVGGGEEDVQAIVCVVGQRQAGIVLLLASLVDVEMGLAAVVVPGRHTVLTGVENVKLRPVLLFHRPGEDLVYLIKGSGDISCFLGQAFGEGV